MYLKNALTLAVLSGFMAEHAPDEGAPKGATVASLTKDKPLSGVILKAFFEGSDAKKVAEKVAAAEGSRLQYLFRTFPHTDVNGVKTAVKEFKEMHAKEHGESKEAKKVANARAAEVQSLYGAWRFGEFNPEGMGYHPSVAAARQILKSKAMRWSGDRIPEQWERDIRKQVEAGAQVELAAKMEVERKERAEQRELTADEEQAIYAKAKEQQAKADMIALARGIFKKYGAEKCEHLIDALEATIASEEQAAKDSASTKQARAA